MTTDSIEASEQVRDALRRVLRNAKGMSNDEVVEVLRAQHDNLLKAARLYLERVAIIKLISDVSDKRRSIVVADQNQTELFDLPHPEIIAITILEEGKPKRIRKDFLDATLEEADKALAPAPIKVPNVDKNARARAFVERLRPIMTAGMTFREAIAIYRKK